MQKTITTERPLQSALDDTQKAIAKFEALVQNIPGLLAVRVRGEGTLPLKALTVVAASLFGEEARRVVAHETRLFRKFPKAHLDVRIEGIEQGGRLHLPDDLPE